MVRTLHLAASWALGALGLVHLAATWRIYGSLTPAALWFFSGGLFMALVAAVNLLHGAGGGVARGLGAVVVASNLVMTGFASVAGVTFRASGAQWALVLGICGTLTVSSALVLAAKPLSREIAAFLAFERDQPFSYPETGATRGTPPPGYTVDHHRRLLGHGPAAFAAACAALRDWRMFRLGWVEPHPSGEIAPGVVAGVLVRWGGLWWRNACRIVYVLDEPRRFAFAYGTLRAHAERGEERFLIEWLEDDSVWFDMLAFSRPGHWWSLLGYPLVRRVQLRCVREALETMARAASGGQHVAG
jgi:uncharacterized protein (UPF0548 family)